MLTHLLLSAALSAAPVDSPAVHMVYSGRAGQVAVHAPRFPEGSVVDGILDEPVWQNAALLTGFSQYLPVDGIAAADSTEIFIWYSPVALHIGVRAFDSSGAVHATLANRDQIFSDDNVQFYLSTFNDGRQATFFAVNPLGIQADGALNERGGVSCNGFNCATVTRQAPDLSPDFVWESKGHVTSFGYEVEIRIPLKSLRFQRAKSQVWGFNVLRVIQRSGHQQTWTQARTGAASFLLQSGRLEGLDDLNSEHVLDIVPTATSHVAGAPGAAPGSWSYAGGTPQFGATAKYGLTSNLTMVATVHPDFSQVESDVTRFAFDPRQTIAYPEKRPFFLEGIEQFDAPGRLIYTRNIVEPLFAVKVTGKALGTQIGVLTAVDDTTESAYGDHRVFGIVRLTRDLAPGSRAGFTWTEEHDGPDVNRVVAGDARLLFGGVNSLTLAGALAHDDRAGKVTDAPVWGFSVRHDGRNLRGRASLNAVSDSFFTSTGLLTQSGLVTSTAATSYTWLRPQHAIESVSAEVEVDGQWIYRTFVNGGGLENKLLHLNLNGRLHGGWNAGGSVLLETFGYDPSIYTSYRLLHPDGSTTPFVGQPTIPNVDYLLQGSTPLLRRFDATVFVIWGHDENFAEWSAGNIVTATAAVNLRPTDHLRVNLSYSHQQVNRRTDGSLVSLQLVPHARIDYQFSQAFQVRVISEYALSTRDSLRDDSRTNLPVMLVDPTTGALTRAAAVRNGNLHTDFLLSYYPRPGTVVYLGYGNGQHEPDALNRRIFSPTDDEFFVKLSYLWKVRG